MEPDKHARLGPSNHRWPHCAASISVESQYEDVAGATAIDGTGSHLLLELCLKHGVRAENYVNQTIGTNHHDKPNGWSVDKARCDRVQIAPDYIEQRTKDLKRQGYTVKIIAERKVNPGHAFGRDDWWGTCDITIIGSKGGIIRFIEVVDYKDGRGYVHHENNTQLISYLFGALSEYIIIPGTEGSPQFDVREMDMCRMTIIQPKTEKKPIRYQECTVGFIVNEARKLNEAAKLTDDEDPKFTPDDRNGKGHCQWCKHRKDCSALAAAKTEVAATKVAHTKIETLEDFVQLGMNCDHIPSEQMATLLDSEAPIMAVFKSLLAEVQLRIDRGEKVPGFAMQPGAATRNWNVDDKKIRTMLRNRKLKLDDLAPRKTLSFPQVEKLGMLTKEQKKSIEAQYVSSVTGADKLTRVSYKESNKPDVDEMFGAIEVINDKPDKDKVIQSETKGLQSKTDDVQLEPLEEVSF